MGSRIVSSLSNELTHRAHRILTRENAADDFCDIFRILGVDQLTDRVALVGFHGVATDGGNVVDRLGGVRSIGETVAQVAGQRPQCIGVLLLP
jgi:hypothetical protein